MIAADPVARAYILVLITVEVLHVGYTARRWMTGRGKTNSRRDCEGYED